MLNKNNNKTKHKFKNYDLKLLKEINAYDDKSLLNSLKAYHKYLFNNKNDDKELNQSFEYETIDFCGKQKVEAIKLKTRKNSFTSSSNGTQIDFHNVMNNPFINYLGDRKNSVNNIVEITKKIQNLLLNPNTSKKRSMIKLENFSMKNKKQLKKKDLKTLSKEGIEKLENEKKKKLNKLLQNTNKDVIRIKKQMDDLVDKRIRKFQQSKIEYENDFIV